MSQIVNQPRVQFAAAWLGLVIPITEGGRLSADQGCCVRQSPLLYTVFDQVPTHNPPYDPYLPVLFFVCLRCMDEDYFDNYPDVDRRSCRLLGPTALVRFSISAMRKPQSLNSSTSRSLKGLWVFWLCHH